MATGAKQEQEGFWDELEKLFDRQIPIKNEVRYAIDTVFKRVDVFDPEEREGVIDAAEHIAYEIVTAAFRGEDAEEVQKEVIKNMSEESKTKAKEDKKSAAAIKHRTREYDITPGNFLEMFEGVKKLPKKCEQREASKEEREKVHYLIYGSIYREILEKIVEKEKDFLAGKHLEVLLKMKEVKKINSKYSVDTETLDFYGLLIYEKYMMTAPEPPSVTYSSEFLAAKDRLIKSAVKMTHIVFEKRQGDKNAILDDKKKKKLTEKIDAINYPTSSERDLGLLVDYTAYDKWKEGQSSHEVRLFNDCVTEVREKLDKIPDLVERWGSWVYEVSEQLKSGGSSLQWKSTPTFRTLWLLLCYVSIHFTAHLLIPRYALIL